MIDWIILTSKIGAVMAAFIGGIYVWVQVGENIVLTYGLHGILAYGILTVAGAVAAIVEFA